MKIAAVIMASGHSTRFQGNKLWAEILGKPVIYHTLKNVNKDLFSKVIVVSRDEKICELAENEGYTAVLNNDTTNDMAVTIRLGINEVPDDYAGCQFFVADQPFLMQSTIKGMISQFEAHPDKIQVMQFNGQRSNPVIFPRSLFEELKQLKPDEQGRVLLKRHPDMVMPYNAQNKYEVFDIDYRKDLKELEKLISENENATK